MKTAITVWNNRVAPVFDTAETCMLLGEKDEPSVSLSLPKDEKAKAAFLKEHEVSTLICGGISCECEKLILNEGITLIPFIAGAIDDVVSAWKENRLLSARFGMPGCGCPRRRRIGSGRGNGVGRGDGIGRGNGIGRGDGIGRGSGIGRGRGNACQRARRRTYASILHV